MRRGLLLPVAIVVAIVATVSPAETATPLGGPLYVDIASVGGRCDDSRLVLLVSLRTPWCSLTKALADAPAGSTVYVRGGRYPELVVPSYAPASLVSYEGYDNERPIIAGVQIGSDQTASRNFALRGVKL